MFCVFAYVFVLWVFFLCLLVEGILCIVGCVRVRTRLLLHTQAVQSQACTDGCAYMYDAVFAAAIAVSSASAATNGALTPSSLNSAIRTLDFVGATGRVRLNPATGDRADDGRRTLLRNWQPDATGGLLVASVWEWSAEAGLERVNASGPPVWPGGEQSWRVPLDGSTCDPGTALKEATLSCEKCPEGTAEVGGACKPCAAGTVAPVAGLTQCVPCAFGYADEEGMSKCKPCGKHAEMRPGALGTSASDCECLEGYWMDDGQCVPCPVSSLPPRSP